MALGLFLGLAPAGLVAQTQTYESDTTQQQTTEPAAPEAQQQSSEPAMPETDTEQQTSEPAMPESDTEQQTSEPAMPETDTEQQTSEPVTPDTDAEEQSTEVQSGTGEVIPAQDETEMLASSLMGASVSLADESIGSVSDLIIAEDNTITGVVVGVGGFLGIGEKKVALPMDQITIQQTEPGVVELSADTTREELESFEAFKTASEVRAEEEAVRAQQEAEQQQQTQQPQQ